MGTCACMSAFVCVGVCIEGKGWPEMLSHLPVWDMVPHWPSRHKLWETVLPMSPQYSVSAFPGLWLQVCAVTSGCLPRCWRLNLDLHEFNESILLTVQSPRSLRFFFFLRVVVMSLFVVRNNQFMNSLQCVSSVCFSYMCTCGVCGCTCLYQCQCLPRSLSTLNFETRFVLEPDNQSLVRLTDQQALWIHMSLSLTCNPKCRAYRHL